MILVDPSAHSLNKELAWCYLGTDESRLAIRNLGMYLPTEEDPKDAAEVQRQVQEL